ncbi:cholinesterase 1-like [Acanthaster planci]|uniref:Carboxylic ester hydrolase n=1 Tax=Acanthaster planci TaxID=133434 RepID=A0A8B7ZKP4_ACAPL|nr:cholinesterase 1-like [Acanthaster planci]
MASRESGRLTNLSAIMSSLQLGIRALVALCTFVALSGAQDHPTVTVQQGVLVGTTETFQESRFINVNKDVDVFKGIPFAEPPVGPLRFRHPVAKEPWDGTYNATYFRDACIQDPAQLFGASSSEDCLHLNIYAPKPAVPGGAAVMVWIHGGGFTAGSAVLATYSGLPLVSVGDVIVVTINYRLNVFGFLTTGGEALPGNLGLLDQVKALEWIKENIGAFGGDSNRITIFGESAGAASVSYHLLSSHSNGLFNRAVLQSGTAFAPWAFTDNRDMPRQQISDLGEKLGCSTAEGEALVQCLRDKDALALFGGIDLLTFRSFVVVDGTFLVDTPANLYATGRYNHADVLLGTMKDEGTLPLLYLPNIESYLTSEVAPTFRRQDFDDIVSFELSSFLGGNNEQLHNAIRMKYTDWSRADYDDYDYFRSYVEYATDYNFACGTDQVARFHFQGGDNVFLYQMTHVPSVSIFSFFFGDSIQWLGSGHGEDIPFVFGSSLSPELGPLFTALTDEERMLSVEFMRFWTTFAKTGNPSSGISPFARDFWPRFTVPELEYKVLSLNLTTSRALKSDQCYFWNTYVPQLRTMLADLDVAEREWRQAFSTWKYTDLADWRKGFTEYKAINMN